MFGVSVHHTHTLEPKESIIILHSSDRLLGETHSLYTVVLHERPLNVSEIHVVAADVPEPVDATGAVVPGHNFGYLHMKVNDGIKIPTNTIQSGSSKGYDHEPTATDRNGLADTPVGGEHVLGVLRLGDPSGKCIGGHTYTAPISEIRNISIKLTDRHGVLLPTNMFTQDHTIVLQVKCTGKKNPQ